MNTTLDRRYLKIDICAFLAFYLNSGMIANIINLLYIFITGRHPFYLLSISVTFFNLALVCLIMLTRKIELKFFALLFIMLGLYGVSVLITPQILILFKISLVKVTLCVLLVYLLSCVDKISRLFAFLTPYVYVGVAYAILYYLMLRKGMLDKEEYDYMGFTYNNMIPMLTAMSITFQGGQSALNIKRPVAAFCFLALFAANLLVGGRGSILCVGICALISLYFLPWSKKVVYVSVISAAALILLLYYHEITSMMASLFPYSRVISKLQEGTLVNTQTSARTYIYKHVLRSVAESPFAVRGLFSDRIYIAGLYGETAARNIGGWYAHNVILELLYQFGLYSLPAIALWLYVFAKQAAFVKKLDYAPLKCLFSVSAAYCIGQLTVSSSYLIAQSFAFLLGILLYMNRKKERRRYENTDSLSIHCAYAGYLGYSLD